MPLYEYTCLACETQFEELVRSSSQTIICPSCKSDTIEKQLSVFQASSGQSGASSPCGKRSDSGCGSGFS